MKKAVRKALAIGFAAVLGLSVLAGCGAQEEFPGPEEFEEMPEDFGDVEEGDFEMEVGEEANEPIDEPAAAAEGEAEGEPAEGLSDQVLMQGYYGAWKGDTEYIFGVLSDKEFMINVVGASSPLLFAEGEYKDNGDGTYTATITSTDNDFAANQTITIKAEGGPDISLTSDNAEVKEAVEAAYTFAGEAAADVEKLK